MNMRVKKKAEKVAFKDVVGCDEAKGEIKQVRHRARRCEKDGRKILSSNGDGGKIVS